MTEMKTCKRCGGSKEVPIEYGWCEQCEREVVAFDERDDWDGEDGSGHLLYVEKDERYCCPGPVRIRERMVPCPECGAEGE